MSHTPSPNFAGRFAGATLIAANLLSAVAILHHPTGHGHTAMERIDSLAKIQPFNGLIHGGIIAMLLLTWLALGELSAQRGSARACIRNAGRLFALGTAAMTGAALINGFIGPALALSASGGGVEAANATMPLLQLCWAANQTLAGFGLLLLSAGIALWSSELLAGPTRIARAAGAYGLLVAVGCASAFLSGALHLDVGGMIVLVFTQAIWYTLIGIALLRGDLSSSARTAG